MLYGVQGIGKSLCAATFESPIVLRTEDGLSAMDVGTFPELVTTYQDLVDAIKAPMGSTISGLLSWTASTEPEPLIWQAVCADHLDDQGRPLSSIEGIGYGKGYVEADAY